MGWLFPGVDWQCYRAWRLESGLLHTTRFIIFGARLRAAGIDYRLSRFVVKARSSRLHLGKLTEAGWGNERLGCGPFRPSSAWGCWLADGNWRQRSGISLTMPPKPCAATCPASKCYGALRIGWLLATCRRWAAVAFVFATT